MAFWKITGIALIALTLSAGSAPRAFAVEMDFSQSIGFGSRGDAVRRLQTILSRDREIYPEGIVSGWFGPLTRKAVARFQRRHGIEPAAGFFGPITREKMRSLATESSGRLASASAADKKKEGTAAIPATAVFNRGATTSVATTSLMDAIMRLPREEISGGNGDGASSGSGPLPEPRVKIKDESARHSCAIEPFSRSVLREQNGDYSIMLTPSAREKQFTLFTGSLPGGVEAVFRSKENDSHTVALALNASNDASRGSFNAVVIYEEMQNGGVALRSFCQLNLVIE